MKPFITFSRKETAAKLAARLVLIAVGLTRLSQLHQDFGNFAPARCR